MKVDWFVLLHAVIKIGIAVYLTYYFQQMTESTSAVGNAVDDFFRMRRSDEHRLGRWLVGALIAFTAVMFFVNGIRDGLRALFGA